MSNEDKTKDWDSLIKSLSTPSSELLELRKQYRPYQQALNEYSEKGNGNWDDFPKETPTDGWKFHLNAKPKDVKAISEFLKQRGFKHKYLSGGEVESGKIFTIYTGSKKMTEKAVKEISDNVGRLLIEPKASGEAPFAPNIVGRFEGSRDEFNRKACRDGIIVAREKPQINDANIQYAREKLSKIYGDYFGEEISYYEPE